jgi:hypothetical protein
MSNIAIVFSIPKGHVSWCRNLKGLSHESEWLKSGENLGASPLRETYRLIPLSAKSISLVLLYEEMDRNA